MFGLEGSGFIIAISVSLLLVGAVVYYFNARVAALEKGVASQAAILQNFIGNVKEQLMHNQQGGGMVHHSPPTPPDNGAAPSAVAAAQEWATNNPRSLVAVSDDDGNNEDEDEDDEDSSSLGETDDDDEDDDDEDNDDEDDEDDDEDDSGADNPVLNLGENVPSLEGLLGINNIAVVKVEPNDVVGVTMMAQALDLDGQEVVDLTHDENGPQITEITAEPEVDSDKAVKQISLGELDSMESIDNTVEESLKSSSLGSSLDDGNDSDSDSDSDDSDEDAEDAITADTATSIPAGTDFSKMTVKALKGAAKKASIDGYSKMNKKSLIAALNEWQSNQ